MLVIKMKNLQYFFTQWKFKWILYIAFWCSLENIFIQKLGYSITDWTKSDIILGSPLLFLSNENREKNTPKCKQIYLETEMVTTHVDRGFIYCTPSLSWNSAGITGWCLALFYYEVHTCSRESKFNTCFCWNHEIWKKYPA